MPNTWPPRLFGPRHLQATCSQAPGLQPRSRTLAPASLQSCDRWHMAMTQQYEQLCVAGTPGAMSLCFCCNSCNLKADLAKYPSDCRRRKICEPSRCVPPQRRGRGATEYLGFFEELVVQHTLAGFAQMRRLHCHAPSSATDETVKPFLLNKASCPQITAANSDLSKTQIGKVYVEIKFLATGTCQICYPSNANAICSSTRKIPWMSHHHSENPRDWPFAWGCI